MIDVVQRIAPIPTVYGHVEYRSRTEARWSRFFEVLGLEAHYEAEGYPLPSGWYLPDWWLPSIEHFAEIKGPEFTESEIEKCVELAIATGFPVLLLPGPPADKCYERCSPEGDDVAWDLYRFHGNVEAAVAAAVNERFGKKRR